MNSYRSDLHDIELHFHHETEKALLVSENGVREAGLWLPKSKIEYEIKGATVFVTCPEWLAVEKGLL